MKEEKDHWVFRLELHIPKPMKMARFLNKNAHWIICFVTILVGALATREEIKGYGFGVIYCVFGIVFWFIFRNEEETS